MTSSINKHWSGKGWSISFNGQTFSLTLHGKTRTFAPTSDTPMFVRWSWFRRFLHLGQERLVRLSGMSRQDIAGLVLSADLCAAVRWSELFTETIDGARARGRWIPEEATDRLITCRPATTLIKRIERAALAESLSPDESLALQRMQIDIRPRVAETNEHIRRAELATQRQFFDRIERQPLTEEQANAVITFDNRVQVVAAAGSGKTSVMVARAAYAVHRGFVPPERILLLAFNRSAAEELQQRVRERLQQAGIDPQHIRASTFHSFGLDLIGRATGARPRPAPWLEAGRDLEVLQDIVERLRQSSPEFRYKWDLFRLIFLNVAPTPDGGDHDHWDGEARETGFGTYDGKYVRSHGERLIADFLHLNGVKYEYERPYTHRTASPERSQYRPDFYYPEADLWHEHWGLDRNGNPPAAWYGYAEGMAWKRETHQHYGTKLIESTWHDVVNGTGLADLESQLRAHGIELNWDPERPLLGGEEVDNKTLYRLIRTFMTHVKSGKRTETSIQERLLGTHSHLAGTRTELFLDLYWPIHKEWDRRLRAEEFVDFEDMLSIGADILESGGYDAPYDLILVDELQDASLARARIIRGLTNKPGKYLLAVGDDWQSINRFAGADISVMTDFHNFFGAGPRLELTTTFRCTQRICDVSSTFVMQNPRQLRKHVQSIHAEQGRHVLLIRDPEPARALSQFLQELSVQVASGTPPERSSGRTTVDILGRYRFDDEVMPRNIPRNLDVTFRTVHGAKGLEADYVVIANARSGKHGFPTGVADDQVLDLAMSEGDTFHHAEERRLFYVALTRARHQVVVLAPPGRESTFFVELGASDDVTLSGAVESGTKMAVCSACGQGTLVTRKGPHGVFLGCSRFPACRGPKRETRTSRPTRTTRPSRPHPRNRRRRY